MKKRFLAWILALVMIVSLLPAAVLATGAETLAEMVYAAAANATITLGDGTYELPSGATQTVPTGLTIVGNGADKTTVTVQGITPGESSATYFFDGGKAVTFKNLTIDFGTTENYDGFARAGNMTFENVTIKGMGSLWGTGAVKFTNCSFVYPDEGYNEWTYNLWTYSGSSFEFDNCTFSAKLGGGSDAVNQPAKSKFVNVYNQAEEGTVSVSLDTCRFVTVKENGTTVEANKPILKIGTGSAWNISLTDIDISEAEAAVDATTGSKLYGDSGITSKPSTSITINGATVWANGKAYAAMIGDISYATLAAAITAAQNGDTIKLLKDVTETVTIPKDKTLTLDLNGKDITVSSGCAIVNKGKLTVTGSGDVTAEQAAVANFPGASAALNGGTYSSAKWYVIKNLGEMVIDGPVTVKKPDGSTDPSSLIDNGWYGDPGNDMNQTYPTSAVEVKLTIKSGDFTGEAGSKSCSVVKNDDYGVLVITGGTFNSMNNKGTSNATTILNWNVTTISGGTFIGMYPISNGSYDNDADQGILTITGGSFTGKSALLGQGQGGVSGKGTLTITGGTFDAPAFGGFDYTLVISGGTFTMDPTDYLADGYIVKKLDDGTWGVSEKEPEFPSWITALPALDGSKKLPFTDVWRGDWYYDGVRYVYDNDLMNGTSGTEFSPNADTTRGMIVTILARMDGVNTSGTPWYEAGREWAMRNGISDGTNMEGKITREQLAAMLSRYAALKNRDVSAITGISAYADASSVSNWAVNAMRWAVGEGLIQGSNNHLRPQSNATRAEVATILMRFCELLKK